MTNPLVFVSYSHKDEKEKEQLLTHLGVLEHIGLIDLWSDDRISAGAPWEEEIGQTIAQAKVAILLISANFLTSEFTLNEEIPVLLQRHRHDGLVIFPVIAKACAWQNIDWLTEMQIRPQTGNPIWGRADSPVDEYLAAIVGEVAVVVRGDEIKAFSPSTPKERVQIFVQGTKVSSERQSAAVEAFAAVMGIAPQAIELFNVQLGSIIYNLGIPSEAVQRLRSILQQNSMQLHLLKVEKVRFEKTNDNVIEEWVSKEGKFELVISNYSTTARNGFAQADFLGLSSSLSAILQNIINAQHVDPQELREIAKGLNSLITSLDQFVHGRYIELATADIFEDLIALIWRISWRLHIQKDFEINDIYGLNHQLRSLHAKL